MSSIIRWRKGETLRTAGTGYPKGVVWLLMASNDNPTAAQEKVEAGLSSKSKETSERINSREAG
jgi:hypothetical protein